MASNLGSMVLELSANTARFQSDMGKAAYIAQQNAAAMQKAVAGAVDGISSKLGDIAGKLVAAFSLDRLIEFGNKAIETADQFQKMSQKVGVSVETLSALGVQAKLSGVGIDELRSGMEKLARNASEAAVGSKQQASAFSSIGVAVKDATGNLRPMQEILGDVSKKFAGYADSASKTALAQKLFGKAGAELIPMLNDLGDKGIAGVTAQAEKFGAVISGETARKAEEFKDNISKLGIEASGFANTVVSQLLPSLEKLTSSMVEASSTTDNYAGSAGTVATGIKVLIASLLTAKEIIAGVATTVFAFFDAVSTVFNAAGRVVQAWGESTAHAIEAAFHFDLGGLDAADAEFKSKMATIGKDVLVSFAGVKAGLSGGLGDAVKNAQADWSLLFGAIDETGKSVDKTSGALRKGVAPLVENAAASEAAANAAQNLADLFTKDAETLASLAGKLNPVQAKYQEYIKSVIAANKAYQDEIVLIAKAGAGNDALAKAKSNLIAKTDASAKALAAELAQLVKQNDIVGKLFARLRDDSALVGLTDRQKEQAQAVAECVRAWLDLDPAIRAAEVAAGKIDPTTRAGTAAIEAQVGALYDQKKAADLAQEAARGWESIWSSAANGVADTFAKVLVSGGNMFDGLKDLAKQTVQQIIAYFARLAVINPILNAIFGGSVGGSLLPTLANAAVSSAGSSAVASYTGGSSSGGSAGGSLLSSGSSLYSAGQSLFGGFQSAATTFWGGSATNPASANFMGPPVQGQVVGPQYGGYASGLQQGLGIATAVYAGYSRFKNTEGGAAGVAGGVTYAAGTYALGAGISSAAAGTGFAAGVSGAFAAIPVIGWIALAVMLIDHFSGGKVFGTKFQTKGSTTSLGIGPDGGNATASLLQSRQGALFSGTKWRTKTTDAGADAQAAAQALFDAVQHTMVVSARQLEIDVPPVIQASLDVVNTYDKKGKLKSTKFFVDVLGKKYEEATQELAATRIAAEAIVATVAASEAGKAASTIAEQWRSSADTLMEGAQFLLAATTDITRGLNLLGEGGTLTDIAAVVVELQQGGETLVQTYQRIGQETEVMRQALELTGVNIGKTGAELVRFADGVANAAGGLSNFTQLVQTFNQAYFTAAELQAQGMKTLKEASDKALTGIGENPSETMAQFKQDFLAILPSLTPEQLAKWYEAGVALATFTKAVTDTANQLAQAKMQYAALEIQLHGDEFISAFAGVVQAEQQQIEQANALAKAAGFAGASQADLASIMNQGGLQMGATLAKLANGIESDLAIIYGAVDKTGGLDGQYIVQNSLAENQAKAADAQAQKLGAAYDVIGKLGDYAFASGKSISDTLKDFGISPEQLAATLGVSPDKINQQIQAAEDNAAALTQMAAQGDVANGLLQDILAAIQGKPLPYDLSALAAPVVSTAAPGSGKPGNPNQAASPAWGGGLYVTAAASDGTAQAVEDGTKPVVDAAKEGHALLRDLIAAVRERYVSNRNTRPMVN